MPADSARILMRPVRPAVVAKYLAELWLPLAGALLVPLAVALALGELGYAWRAGVVVAAIAAVAVPLARRAAPRELQWNEALAVVALIFVTGSLAVAWPFVAFGLAPLDAWFEGVSAITTTGLTTVGGVEGRSPAFLFARAWIQWYAGFLIVVVGLALVLGPGVAAKRFASSGLGEDEADVVGGTRTRAREALWVYLILTAAGLLAVLAAGAAPFEALLHVFTAVSTAGFSSHDDSIAALPGAVQIVLTVISLLGAVSFLLYVRAAQQRLRGLWRDPELAALLGLCLAGSLALTAILGASGQLGWGEAALRAPLLAISAQSTTGFEPLAPAALDDGSKLVLIASMLIGGDVGSTAGGIKIIRFLVILALLRLILLRTAMPPHGHAALRVAGRRIEAEDLQAALGVVLLFLATIALSWLALLLLGVDAIDGLFEVVSAVGTVGLSAGVSAPELAPLAKVVLCLDMLAGRVEIVALLVLLYPPSWLARRR